MTYMETVENQSKFEQSLQAGDFVQARWTNSYNAYSCRAKVVKVNRSSIRIELSRNIVCAFTRKLIYPIGQQFSLPRSEFGSKRWSVNNGVFPSAN